MSRRRSCERCGSLRVHHCVEYDGKGEVEGAWFQCATCGLQFSNFKLSESLLLRKSDVTDDPVTPQEGRSA